MCLLCCQLAMEKGCIYACLPIVFDKLLATGGGGGGGGARANGSIVVVVSSLTAIMKDQVSGITKNKFSPASTLVNY